MNLTAIAGGSRGARSISAGAVIFLIAGLATTGVGIAHSAPAASISGAFLAVMALTCIALALLRRWIKDTSAERARLAAATFAANEERTRYIASLAALDAERGRVRRDASLNTARMRTQLDADREKIRDEFERQRERIVGEAFTTGALMERGGLLKEPQPATVTPLFMHGRDPGARLRHHPS